MRELTILLIGIVIGGLFLAKGVFVRDSWDLIVCKTLMEDGIQCFDNSYVLKGYKTQAECVEKGLELAEHSGFECGRNCRKSKNYSGIVCDIICNKAGCSD